MVVQREQVQQLEVDNRAVEQGMVVALDKLGVQDSMELQVPLGVVAPHKVVVLGMAEVLEQVLERVLALVGRCSLLYHCQTLKLKLSLNPWMVS